MKNEAERIRDEERRAAAIRAEATILPDYTDRERNIVGRAVAAILGETATSYRPIDARYPVAGEIVGRSR